MTFAVPAIGGSSGPLEADEAVASVAEAAHGPSVSVWDQIEEFLDSAVLAAVREAGERHGRLLTECGFRDPDAPSQDGAGTPAGPTADQARDALVRYRRGVVAELFEPLERAMSAQPTGHIVSELLRARSEAHQAARRLPVRTEVRWGAGALAVIESDSSGRRARKALAKWLSSARKESRTRAAPLRAVALHHVRDRVAPLLDQGGSEAVRAWASWVFALERGCAAWAERALPVVCWADVATRPPPVLLDTLEDWGEEVRVNGPGGGSPAEVAAAPELDVAVRAWFQVRHASLALDTVLTQASELGMPHVEARAHADRLAQSALEALDSDVRVAGSFVHRPRDTAWSEPPVPGVERARGKLADWDAQARARWGLHRTFIGVLLGFAAIRGRLAAGIREAALDPLAQLRASADALAALARGVRSGSGPLGAPALDDLRRAAASEVETALAVAPDPKQLDGLLERLADDTIDALQGLLRQLPDRVVLHRLETMAHQTLRRPETRVVALQELARQSLDALRVERLRTAVLDFGPRYEGIHAGIAELPDVVAFAFDAALKELDVSVEGALDEAGLAEEVDAHPSAVFAAEALERAAGVLGRVPDEVAQVLAQTEARLALETANGGLALFGRLGAGRVQSQFLRFRSELADGVARFEERLGPGWTRARRRMRALRIRGVRASRRWWRRGHALMGGDGVAPAGRSQRTLRAFAREDSGPGHVPLVYQRLFALTPLTDPGFLVGRSADVSELVQRWRRWRDDHEVPVVVRGLPGRGVSSFLHATAHKLRTDGARVETIDFPDRILDEGVLVARVAGALGVPPGPSLEALAGTVLGASAGSLPDAVVMDGLEHLYLRVPGGTDLLERFLTFLSETEPRVFWLAGISQSAWKLIAMTEPFAVLQVHDFELAGLTEDRLRETILQRHRRSGLKLRFEEPREGRALLRRRVRRLRGTEGHQALLADDFFDQLHRVALGDLKLALFHWMLAADFEAAEGEVLLRPPLRPDFGMLDSLSPAQQYTLKAFLEHRTLTLSEHDAIFRMPHQESYQLFESLQNRHLVEELDPGQRADRTASEIHRTSRYRIRPLLVGAVIEHLSTRNIVH